MKKTMVIALMINTYILTMESNLDHRFNKDKNDDAVQLLDVIENKKTPRGHVRSEKIDTLDERISKTKLMIQNGVKQPFSTWFGALNYIKQHALKDEQYECYLCKLKFSQAVSAAGCFLRHYDPNLFTCDVCESVLESSISYKNHTCIAKILKIKNKESDYCVVPSVNEDFLRNYVNEKLATISCCDIPLGNWATALNHSSLSHKESRVKYRCNFCKKIHQTNEKALECYVIHKDKSIFECPSCNIVYTNRATLLGHQCKPKKVIEPAADLDELEIALTNNSTRLSINTLETEEHNQAPFDDHFSVYDEHNINNFWTSDAESFSVIEKDEASSVSNPLHITHDNFHHTNCDYNPSDFSDGQTSLFTDQLLDEKNYSFSVQSSLNANQLCEPSAQDYEKEPNTTSGDSDKHHLEKSFTLEGYAFNTGHRAEDNRFKLGKLILGRLNAKIYSCCALARLSWSQLRSHISETHVSLGKIMCLQCDSEFANITGACHHIALHQYPDLFRCPLCASKNKLTTYNNTYNLENHFAECLAQEHNSQGGISVHCLVKNSLALPQSKQSNDDNSEKDSSVDWIDYSVAEYQKLKNEKKYEL